MRKELFIPLRKSKNKIQVFFKPISNRKTIWNDKKLIIKRIMSAKEISNKKYTAQFIRASFQKSYGLRKVYYNELFDLIITYPTINYQGLK